MSEAMLWRKLSAIGDELTRLGAIVARNESSGHPAPTVSASEVEGVDLAQIRAIIRARRLRAQFFPQELFADPAWDILLALLAAEIASAAMPVTALCEEAAVPPTTALRWIKQLTDQGLLLRRQDPLDGRRVFIELASSTSQKLRRYFQAVAVNPI